MFPAALLIQIVIVLVIIGLLLWGVSQIPMDATLARIIRVVVIVAVCLWLLSLVVGWVPVLPLRR